MSALRSIGLGFLAATLASALMGCSSSTLPSDAGLDAPLSERDAPPDDAPLDDAPRVDAAAPQLVRDPLARPLRVACGERLFDLDDPTTYDTAHELGNALVDATCERQIRCHDQDAFWCDPIHTGAPPVFVVPIDTAVARRCLELVLRPCESHDAAPSPCLELDADRAPDGSVCSRDDTCRSGYCTLLGPLCGGHCATPLVCPPCGPDAACVRGVCDPLLGIGDSCLFVTESCVPGAWCDGSHCVANLAEGEPCDVAGFPGIGPSCNFGLGCAAGRCVPLETVAIGDACDRARLCPAESDCVDDACAARPGLREPCDGRRLCQQGLWCNGYGVCAPVVGPGCACDERVACPGQFVCLDGTCERLGAVPTPCDVRCRGDWCQSGFCDYRFIGERCRDGACHEEHAYCDPATDTCLLALVPGDDCSGRPDACAGGVDRCVDGVCVAIPRDPCRVVSPT